MDSLLVENENSPSSPLLPTIEDINIEINKSPLELKLENDDYMD